MISLVPYRAHPKQRARRMRGVRPPDGPTRAGRDTHAGGEVAGLRAVLQEQIRDLRQLRLSHRRKPEPPEAAPRPPGDDPGVRRASCASERTVCLRASESPAQFANVSPLVDSATAQAWGLLADLEPWPRPERRSPTRWRAFPRARPLPALGHE